MTPHVTIFCGKGGVGKTCLSLAFGLRQASLGKKVLVVTSHPVRELALSVSLAGLKETQPETASNLLIVHIDPRQVVARTLREQFPSRMLAERVLASKVYQNIVEIAPGIKELAFLGRLKELTVEGFSDGEPYGSVIWDAPATGHFLETLKATRKLETYLTGPLASRGRELARFYSDAQLDLFPVTTLEEMAVEETLEMCSSMVSDLDLHPDGLVCNMVSPLAGVPDREMEALSEMARTSSVDGLSFVLGTARKEKTHLLTLQSRINTELLLIERVGGFNTDLELLDRVSHEFAHTSLGTR